MIAVSDLNKNFGAVCALRNVSFEVQEGEVFGLLGPNGAGKTTTLNILSTLARPDSGSARMAGHDLFSAPHKIRPRLGVVPQELALYPTLSATDNIRFFGSLYGLSGRQLKLRADAMLQLVGLSDRARGAVATFSGGMKRRLNFACSLLHDPDIVFLDEPTAGVDPQSRNMLFELIENLKTRGKTMIYTTHYMEEAERLCDRIAIMDEGEIRACGTHTELLSRINAADIVELHLEADSEDKLDSAARGLGPEAKRQNGTVRLPVKEAGRHLAEILQVPAQNGCEVSEITIRRANLESVFLQLTGKNLRD
jgi:ABC-2 type transport system ATP-binding protein